jgi:acyl carrier protein
MTIDLRSAVLQTLGEIAPEVDLSRLDPKVSFREALDIDSMDQLNFVIALHRKLGVEVPERDYPKLETLAGCIDYLSRRMPG